MAPVGVEVAGVRSGSKAVGRRCGGELVSISSLQCLLDRS
jgi:hypothetical protein